jgi:integrase
MNTLKLTPSTIKALSLPAGKTDATFWDCDVGGFGLRLRSSGSRVWILQYDVGGRTKRITLGAVTEMDAGAARKAAETLRARIKLGGDPSAEKATAREEAIRAAGETFGALLPAYLTHQRATVSPRWYVEIERHLNVQSKPLHGRPVAAITLREIAALLDKIAEEAGPVASNRLRGTIAAYFVRLMSKGLLDKNVAANAGQAPTNGARERVLSDAEIAEVWRATDCAGQFDAIVRLLILLGLRRDEVTSLRWSEIDLDAKTITLPPARTKSGLEHVVPLGPQALAILRAQPRRQMADGSPRDLIFGLAEGAGFRNHDGALNLLRERIAANRRVAGVSEPMVRWTLHDLRRSLATGMIKALEIAPHVANACLHHSVTGVAGVYIKEAASFEQRRAALARWDAHLARLVAGKPAKKVVVPFRRRA